jgi:hypothetical protein
MKFRISLPEIILERPTTEHATTEQATARA